MRRTFTVFCLLALTVTLAAQSPAGSQAKAKPFAPKAQLAAPQVLVHAVHAAAVAATCRSSLLLGNLNHQSFGGEQQTGD